EAALIFESKIEKMYDYVVLITADRNLRMKRSTISSKLSEEDFIKRDNNQIDQESKKKKADFVFTNDYSKDELKQKAILLINLLKSTLS
ncbi:MAG: dephospho-CoA kinase, partial [Ignavibacteriaceae bacterium]|nr:dephospho-CoA kinase [Ignavibacteriaceae bacterium]